MNAHERVRNAIADFRRSSTRAPRFLYVSRHLRDDLLSVTDSLHFYNALIGDETYMGLRVVTVTEPEWLEVG